MIQEVFHQNEEIFTTVQEFAGADESVLMVPDLLFYAKGNRNNYNAYFYTYLDDSRVWRVQCVQFMDADHYTDCVLEFVFRCLFAGACEV